jgi:hypothetical protein
MAQVSSECTASSSSRLRSRHIVVVGFPIGIEQ